MHKLNPFAKKKAELLKAAEAKRHAAKAAALKAKRSKQGKADRKTRNENHEQSIKELEIKKL